MPHKKPTGKTRRKARRGRDVEKAYSASQFAAKLRRLADALESGEVFRIRVAGERVVVPVDAIFNIEHEREGKQEEVEFELKWTCALGKPGTPPRECSIDGSENRDRHRGIFFRRLRKVVCARCRVV